MYEFHKNLYLQTVLIDSAEVHKMKYAFFHESQKAKVCHNGKNDRQSVRHAMEQIVTFLLDSFSLAIKVLEDLLDQISKYFNYYRFFSEKVDFDLILTSISHHATLYYL